VFLAAYDHAKREIEAPFDRSTGRHTIGDVITAYLGSADYQQLSASSRADYRRTLNEFRGSFAELPIPVLDEAWIERLREKHVERPIA
jgi:hypothetical protein